MLGTLDASTIQVLEGLIAAPVAWMTPARLASLLSFDVNYTSDRLCDLHLDGWVEIEDRGSTLLVAPSRATIERYRLELVLSGSSMRWARSSRPRTARSDAPSRAPLELVPDDSPGPEALVMAAEVEAPRGGRGRGRRAGEERIGPTITLSGPALIPWEELGWTRRHSLECPNCRIKRRSKFVLRKWCECGRGLRRPPRLEHCPTCRDGKLGPRVECLRCGRGHGWPAVWPLQRGA